MFPSRKIVTYKSVSVLFCKSLILFANTRLQFPLSLTLPKLKTYFLGSPIKLSFATPLQIDLTDSIRVKTNPPIFSFNFSIEFKFAK